MSTTQVATIRFLDTDTNEESHLFVRIADGSVLLGVSIKSNGDIDVALGKADAERLIEALREAVSKLV